MHYDEDDMLKDQHSQDPNNEEMEKAIAKDADGSAPVSNPAIGEGETHGENSSSAPPSIFWVQIMRMEMKPNLLHQT
jgi:hypothetical protein